MSRKNMKLRRILYAGFQSILIVMVFVFLSVLFYTEINSPFKYVIVLITIIAGVYCSYLSFVFMKKRSLIAILAGNQVSPELDNLKPVSSDGVFELYPADLKTGFSKGKIMIGPCTISIWGDSEGRYLKEKHSLKYIDYIEETATLILAFHKDFTLKVISPRVIHQTSQYLKIIYANEICWEFLNTENFTEEYIYKNTGKLIEANSNTNWKPSKFDFGIGMTALYLQA